VKVVLAGRRLYEAWRSRSDAWLVVLGLILVIAFVGRMWDISVPCTKPCSSPDSHTLIFDEAYYVNAARIIDGITPGPNQTYRTAPLHSDPNAEHPQLAKLIIAGGIKLFGDNPWGWRTGSLLFGMIALLGVFWLVRAAGGSRWLAVGATAVMAADNLALVHGRIATLDVYVLAMMLLAGAAYLKRRRWLAGLLLGIGACMKLVGLFLLVTFVLIELFRLWESRTWSWRSPVVRGSALRLVITGVTTCVVLLLGVWIMDVLVSAYDPNTGHYYRGNPFAHIRHMISFASSLHSTPGSTGADSSPLQWLFDQKPIDYAREAANGVANGTNVTERVIIFFRGEVNPFIIFMALPFLFVAAGTIWQRRRALAAADHESVEDEVPLVGLAWFLGTYVPFVVQSDIFHRITYLFYILIALPGLYLSGSSFFARYRRAAVIGWAVALILGYLHQYPIRTLSGF
jgi:4-amino-4-deoxy-L-arabinose transferase-like glycosyltransferase